MKTILLLAFTALLACTGFSQTAPKVIEKDITPLITNGGWKYDHSAKLGVGLRFYRDGRAVSETGWKAVWRKIDEHTIKLTLSDKRHATIKFDEAFTAFSATFFDGEKISGKRLGDRPAGL